MSRIKGRPRFDPDLPEECPMFVARKYGLFNGLTRFYEGDVFEGHGCRGLFGLFGLIDVRRMEDNFPGHLYPSDVRALTRAGREMLAEARAHRGAAKSMSKDEWSAACAQAMREQSEDNARANPTAKREP